MSRGRPRALERQPAVRTSSTTPTLLTLLMKKKKLHKDERTINIGADFDIPWRVIARTIDASRVQLEKPSYAEMEAYTMSKPKMEKDKVTPMPLFDTVVFTVN